MSNISAKTTVAMKRIFNDIVYNIILVILLGYIIIIPTINWLLAISSSEATPIWARWLTVIISVSVVVYYNVIQEESENKNSK